MAKPIPISDAHRNGAKSDSYSWSSYPDSTHGAGKALAEAPPSSDPELWTGDSGEQIVPPALASEPSEHRLRCDCAPEPEGILGDASEGGTTREENARLRNAVKQLERCLEDATKQQEFMAAQVKECESLLDEKSEVIRDLHRKFNEQPERPVSGAPREEELLALSEELERERLQLKEDEATLMQQMRDMEVQMSRERAEMARQRNELQRLQNEIRHELEMAGRDATLRERLAPLQRRHQEMMNRRGAAPQSSPAAPAAPAAGAPEPEAKKDSSLFRRLFG